MITFSAQSSPIAPSAYGVGIAPGSYWRRGLDMDTLVQQMVDQAIGEVVAAIPKSQLGNTVIVFAADHGEYAGARGLLSGKLGTAYEEAINVPLIVPAGEEAVNQYVPQQMEAPLPAPLKRTVAKARASYVAFEARRNW